MQYISLITAVPLRKEPTSKSEKVTELLFGETCTVIIELEEWAFVRCDHDKYEGYVSIERLTKKTIDHDGFTKRNWLSNTIAKSSLSIINIPFGALIPENNTFLFQDDTYSFNADFNRPKNPLEAAKLFLNTPYSWGGRSSFGIDCSGLMQQIFLIKNIALPRDAAEQVNIGETIEYKDREIGDVPFFINDNGSVSHVGILSSKNTIIHAAGFVRKDTFNKNGIFRESEEKQTHILAVIKRFK